MGDLIARGMASALQNTNHVSKALVNYVNNFFDVAIIGCPIVSNGLSTGTDSGIMNNPACVFDPLSKDITVNTAGYSGTVIDFFISKLI